MTETIKLVKSMSDLEKRDLANAWVIANLKFLAERSPYLEPGAECAIKCIEENKVDIFDFAGTGLTVEIYNDPIDTFFWLNVLICHCEMITGQVSA